MVKRVENWPILLSLFLRDRANMPFEWGKNDCLIFAADGVRAITSFDSAARWRGYSTEAEANEIVKFYGGVSGLITEGLGFRGHRNILQARRGDVAMLKLDTGLTAGIVDDTGRAVAVPLTDKNTLVRIPLRLAWRIWSI